MAKNSDKGVPQHFLYA